MTAPDDVRAIEQLLRVYARLNDAARWHEVAKLFTADATFARPSDPDRPIVGRDAILRAFLARPATPARRHLIADPEVALLDRDTARSRCHAVLLVDHGDGTGTISVGGFDDELERTPDGWRFCSRAGFTITDPVACTVRAPHRPDWATPAAPADFDPQPPK